MRDVFFFGFFIVVLALSFRKPFVLIGVWLWSGIFVPVYWLYGFASAIRFNLILSIAAIISYFLFYKKKTLQIDSLFFLFILFFIHTTITTANTIVNPTITWIAWEYLMKAAILSLFIVLAIRNKTHFNFMVWMCVLSVGFFGTVEALKFVKSGGAHHINGPYGHLIGDNNHLALAILMIIPLTVYLISEISEKWLKTGLIAVLILCILAVLGTKSRGGFLGLLLVGGYFWLKSKRKISVIIAFSVVTLIASNFLTDSWFSRMQTMQDIETIEEDASVVSRVASWKIHTLMAIERPVLGGGFRAPQYSYIWRSLAENYYLLDFIPTGPPGDKSWAAHSIYFQVLGDHGFVGFTLFMLMIGTAFLKLSIVEKYFKGQWQEKFAKMIKVSLVAFCVTGAAVSMAYFELFYVLLALITCLSLMKKREENAENLQLINNANEMKFDILSPLNAKALQLKKFDGQLRKQ